ncbi:glutaminase A [Clathrospora elynae]|uniref:Glutaminase A n=1 Tax=Clathrospora elynae TaxID=706981 RepID=A0A6A5S6C6_9PLEO|nr:glutaminase A [Clathrospora elynae]
MRSFSIICAALLASVVDASTLQPPVLPLIVRNPYLSTWLQNAREEPWSKWPMFWTGAEVGFCVLASLPDSNEVFPLLGRPHDSLEHDDKNYTVAYPVYRGAKYDASTTNLTYSLRAPDNLATAKDLEITLSFLSPITPTSTLRQAIPAAYLSIHVEGTFDVNIYVDVNGQWVSGKRESLIEWGLLEHVTPETSERLKTWKVKRQVEQIFTETNDQPEWGQLHFTGPSEARHESGTSSLLRQRFARTGTLQNEVDANFRSVMDDEPVFAFAKAFKLANSSRTSRGSPGLSEAAVSSALFTITHIQDPVTQYASARGLTFMRPLWKSWFPEDDKLIQFHYGDFAMAYSLASNYSEQLRIDAYQSGSTNYVDIVALSARQAMGATSFSGTPENPLLFLKEISSNGNSQTVDVIFPAFPFFLYTQPRWLAYLLEPLLEHQLSGQYPNKYSMHDLGAHFPNLTGHADGRDEYMPVEECGDMLIMGLALVNSLSYNSDSEAQSIWSTIGNDVDYIGEETRKVFALTSSGSLDSIKYIDDNWGGGAKGVDQAKKWLEGSYELWKQWTGYLVEDALEPHNQLCTDDFAGWLPLQTNLALKGIVGIKAFSELADLLDRPGDAKHYRNISESYVKKWEEYGISRDGSHAKLAYDWYGSWTTLYSLYADAVLCFHPTMTNATSTLEDDSDYASDDNNAQKPLTSRKHSSGRTPITDDFIPDNIYKMQSEWYSAVMQKYGLPLDSRHLYTKSDWEFEAAAVASKKVRSEILDRVALWLNETVTNRPFTDLYDTEGDGGFPNPYFFARPVVGGHFAFLTLERACGGRR